MRIGRAGLLAAALLAGVAARDLPVPAGKGWQHAATGLVLPATLDGLARQTGRPKVVRRCRKDSMHVAV